MKACLTLRALHHGARRGPELNSGPVSTYEIIEIEPPDKAQIAYVPHKGWRIWQLRAGVEHSSEAIYVNENDALTALQMEIDAESLKRKHSDTDASL